MPDKIWKKGLEITVVTGVYRDTTEHLDLEVSRAYIFVSPDKAVELFVQEVRCLGKWGHLTMKSISLSFTKVGVQEGISV